MCLLLLQNCLGPNISCSQSVRICVLVRATRLLKKVLGTRLFPNWPVQVIYALFLFQTSTLLTENNSDCCDIGASNIICRLSVVFYCEFLNDS